MKTYAVIHPHGGKQEKAELAFKALNEMYVLISCEHDEGIYFIHTDDSEDDILINYAKEIGATLRDVIYVIEMNENFSAEGTKATIDTLTDYMRRNN